MTASQTVTDLADRYCRHVSQMSMSGQLTAIHASNITQTVRRFAKMVGLEKLATEVRRGDLIDFIAKNPSFKATTTQANVLAIVHRFFNWAAEEELIAAVPYKKPRLSGTRNIRPAMTRTQYVQLMRRAPRHFRLALFFLRRTGCRTCEMRLLRWKEIDWAQGVASQILSKTSRKTGKPRLIGLDGPTLRLLRNILRNRKWKSSDYVFLNAWQRPISRETFSSAVRRFCDELGLPKSLSAYALRHAFCTESIAAGVGERQVADQMGHADTRMISYYSKAAARPAYIRGVAEECNRRRRPQRGGIAS